MPDKESAATPPLKLVIILVFIITILTGIGMFYIAGVQNPTELQKELFGFFRTVCKGGVGALFGLTTGARLS